MRRRTLLASSAALAAAPLLPARAAGKTTIVWWHAMTAQLNDEVNRIADSFNKSQDEIEVQPVYKGGYADTLTATIAAVRAGQAPHLVQIFEVGTGTMLTAGKAVKQVWELSKETGVKLDPAAYIPAVRGYYSLSDGRMASMPFNSSTAVMWYNKDAFRKAGLDPAKPPATWPEVEAAARAIKEKSAAEIPMTTSWPVWIQLEQYAALHNLPYATKENGFAGLDTQLEIAAKPMVKQVQRLLDMAKEGTFRYAGRDNAPDPLLLSGQAGIHFNSSGMRGALVKSAKYDWGVAYLPYDPSLIKEPLNSIIGFTGIILQGLAGPLNAEQAKQLTMVRGSARHLLALINDVLDISKIEAGQLDIHPEPLDLPAAIAQAVASVRPQAVEKGIALHVAVPGTPPMVSDRKRVQQILLNLLSNAVKFTQAGTVTLSAEAIEEWLPPGAAARCRAVRIRVADTGIGIRADDLPKLFQPFRQVDSSLTRLHEGTGLGLAICHRLVGMLGGEIAVSSDWGRGSVFTVTLPTHPRPIHPTGNA